MTEPIRRAFEAPVTGLQTRDSGAGNGSYTVSGHAAVFNRASVNLGGFTERIAPGAFRDVLAGKPDVHLVWNHDTSLTLARSPKTLKLTEDQQGLAVWARVTPTTYAEDLRKLIDEGVIDQMSFMFRLPADGSGETWKRDATGNTVCTVTRVAELFDVTICARGAYPQTDIAVRERSRLETAVRSGRVSGWKADEPPAPWSHDLAAARESFELKRSALSQETGRILDMVRAG